jgi:hypothetical protein
VTIRIIFITPRHDAFSAQKGSEMNRGLFHGRRRGLRVKVGLRLTIECPTPQDASATRNGEDGGGGGDGHSGGGEAGGMPTGGWEKANVIVGIAETVVRTLDLAGGR